MVTWEDRLRSHPAYVHAAIAASEVSKTVHFASVNQCRLLGVMRAQIYVQLHDDPSLVKKSSPSCKLPRSSRHTNHPKSHLTVPSSHANRSREESEEEGEEGCPEGPGGREERCITNRFHSFLG